MLKRAMGALGIVFVSLALIFSPVQPILIPNHDGITLHASIAHAQFGEGGADVGGISGDVAGSGTSASDTTDKGFNCSFTSPIDCLTVLVYWVAVAIPSYFAYVTGTFFGVAVRASLDSGAYALNFLANGWTVIRDIANMAFLFILIYIALILMFRAETHGTLGMLTTVIIVALLVNFSFFITRVVIDGGNILAIQVYNAIPAPAMVNSGSVLEHVGAKDLAGSIMGSLNAQNLLGTESFKRWRDSTGNTFLSSSINRLITLSAVFIPVGIIAAILGFAFLVAAINFISRIVVLWFCIILAPAAWAAAAMPGFSNYYKKWEQALIKHTIYPAVFLFSFLLITLLMKAFSGYSGTLYDTIFNALNDNKSQGIEGFLFGIEIVIIQLAFVILMLKYTFKFSEDMGLATAEVAGKVRNWTQENITGRYRRAGAGLIGWTGRNTLGWAGQRIAENAGVRERAAKGGLLNRTLWRTAKKASESSWDVRNTRVGHTVLGDVAGKGAGKGGWAATFDERVSKRMKEADLLKKSTEMQVNEAWDKVMNGLGAEDRNKIETASNAYEEVLKAKEEGAATTNDVKEARKAYNDEIKRLGIADKVKKMIGGDNAKNYAKAISTKDWRNMWGAFSHPIPAPYLRESDREAAARILKPKNEAERVKNILKNIREKNHEAGSNAPSSGGGGSAGLTVAPLTRQALEAQREQFGSLQKATKALEKNLTESVSKGFGGMQEKQGETNRLLQKGFRSAEQYQRRDQVRGNELNRRIESFSKQVGTNSEHVERSAQQPHSPVPHPQTPPQIHTEHQHNSSSESSPQADSDTPKKL